MTSESRGSSYALQRQREIFLAKLRAKKRAIPVSFSRLKAQAQQKLSEEAFAYIAGAAGREATKRSNRAAFDRWKIVPGMLRGLSSCDTGVELFGTRLPAPFLLAPIGVLEMAHPQADLAVAKAAAEEGIPFIFSSQASVSMEKCSAVMGNAPRWFQLYWSTNNDLVASFVDRAEACGCSAIVLTLDTTMLGWRPRDLDLDYLPFLRGMGIAQYTSDPVFKKMIKSRTESVQESPKPTLESLRVLLQMSRNYPGSFWRNLFSGEPRRAVQTFIETYSRPSLSWDDLSFLRSLTDLPILLKGILRADDARKAVDAGMDGIIVSNHGGRQVDGSISALDALEAISETIEGEIPVLMDSGIRSGSDIVKALALGADAVLLGRPYVYALALAGEAGLRELIRNYRADFELTMRLSGFESIGDIDSNCLEAI